MPLALVVILPLAPYLRACAEERSSAIAHGRHAVANEYVDANEAGYLTQDGDLIAEKTVNSSHFQLYAKKVPKLRTRKLATREEWDAFMEHYASIDVATGKRLAHVPNFKKEMVLAVFSDSSKRGDSFMDIEVYSHENILKGFVFLGHTLEEHDPVKVGKAIDMPFIGNFYFATVPREFAMHDIEFRVAYQSWGRPCSRFSPMITPETPVEDRVIKP